MDNNFYVYALSRKDGGPFYIGMGRGRRWTDHEYQWRKTRTRKQRVIHKIISGGGVICREKIADKLSRNAAFVLEQSFIYLIGIDPDGPLVNATRGGDGFAGPHTMESRARMSAVHKKRLSDPAARLRHRQTHASSWSRKRPRSERARISEKMRLFQASRSFAEKSEMIKRGWKTRRGRKDPHQ